MRYEFLVAFRHITSRQGRTLSLVSLLAVSGVALGVAALVGGLAITSGFEASFRDRLLGVTAHIFARSYGMNSLSPGELAEFCRGNPEVRGAAPISYHKTIFLAEGGSVGGFVKGIEPTGARDTIKLHEYLESGSVEALTPRRSREEGAGAATDVPGIIIGAQLQRRLRVPLGGLLNTLSAVQSEGENEWRPEQRVPSTLSFRVVGVFRAGYDEYDSRFAYVHYDTAMRLFSSRDRVAGVEVALHDPWRAPEVARRLEVDLKSRDGDPFDWAERLVTDPLGALRVVSSYQQDYAIRDWYAQNPNLYMSLLYQRLAILIVLSVMLILAACNVSSLLIMMVMERTPDIAILKACGASERSIRLIFLLEGAGLSLVGTALGSLISYLFCEWILSAGISLDPKVYGIDHFPVHFAFSDCLVAALISLVVISIAALIPARRAGRLEPVEGLRQGHLGH